MKQRTLPQQLVLGISLRVHKYFIAQSVSQKEIHSIHEELTSESASQSFSWWIKRYDQRVIKQKTKTGR